MSIVKKYAYGASAPSLHADLVHEQMRLAHRYRNALVELELTRRKKVADRLQELFPEVADLAVQMGRAEGELAALREGIARRNAVARHRTATKGDREAVAAVRKKLGELRKQFKEAKHVAFATEEWKASQEAINQWHNLEGKRLRAECGVYWGTYLATEKAMYSVQKGPPPKFKRWSGDAVLYGQIIHGIHPEKVMSCTDTRIQVQLGADKRKGVAFMRIGSDESRAPVWAQIPFVMHRPLPPEATVKWVSLVKKRVGTHDHWQFHFDLEFNEKDVSDCAETGCAGVDVGWRRLPDGGLRVAYWVDETGTEGTLVIPEERLQRWAKVEQLQSIRSVALDTIKAELTAWIKQHQQSCPEWLLEKTNFLPLWHSSARLASVVLHWRDNRFSGDNEPLPGAVDLCRKLHLDPAHYGHPRSMFDLLEAWRKKDKHLYDWQAHQQLKTQRWRDHLYRNFAAMLRRSHATIKVENTDWSKLTRAPKSEDTSGNEQLRKFQRIASVGRLLRLLGEKSRNFVKVEAAYTTMTCAACGKLTEQLDRAVLNHTCNACGVSDDQDRIGALNILRASAAIPAAEAMPA